MKLMILLISLFSLFTPNVYAGTSEGKIQWVRVRASDNLHYFRIEGSHINRPSCATSEAWSIKDENSVAGKSQISILLAAWASGKVIRINGSNTCVRWGDMEDANEIYVE